jgi:translocation and assembly module TamA
MHPGAFEQFGRGVKKEALALMGGSSRRLPECLRLRVIVAVTASAVAFGIPLTAQAFDFFGLWSSEDAPPPVSQATLPYSVTIDVAGGDRSVSTTITDASSLYRLRKDAPSDGEALARRAASDVAPVIDALWGAGYYNATVTISLDAVNVTIAASNIAAFAKAAERYRNIAIVPVKVVVDPGPLFALRSIRIVNAAGSEFNQDELPARIVGLKPGDPAVASDLRAAQARIIDWFRNQGRPLAKVTSITPIVDHAALVMDVTVRADPGPIASFGEATMKGPDSFDPVIARSFLYIKPGDPYSPRALQDARAGLRQIPAVGGVRISEGTALDAYGRLPYEITVEDRLPYAVGGSALYSTTNGPAGQVYWEDRNVFGGAERLRLQADLFYAPPWYQTTRSVKDVSINDLGGRISASFLKPALWGTPNDLLVDALAERVSTAGAGFRGYEVEDVDATAALRHRFDQYFSVQLGLQAQSGTSTDALGKVGYSLIGVLLSTSYDNTDSKLDPTRGFRFTASAAGFPTFLGSSLDLLQAKVRASAYYALDADQRFVLAGRVGFGSIGGPAQNEIPANWRFYSGGGGSVRGYAFNSLGPTGPFGSVVGGRSLFEASAELRVRLNDTIGIVPFLDTGNAFTSSLPNFNQRLYTSVGLGLRYFTSVGPIRLDVAFPLQRHAGNGPVALYVSIGQAF